MPKTEDQELRSRINNLDPDRLKEILYERILASRISIEFYIDKKPLTMQDQRSMMIGRKVLQHLDLILNLTEATK